MFQFSAQEIRRQLISSRSSPHCVAVCSRKPKVRNLLN